MSKKHGRRIYDTTRGEDLREKTRSALYEIIAELIHRSPGAANDMGYRRLTRAGGQPQPHTYFEVEPTARTIQRPGALAIYCGDAPRKNSDGSTSHSLRAPMLLMPPEMFEDAEEVMRKIASVLNKHAAEFFDSAKAPTSEPEARP